MKLTRLQLANLKQFSDPLTVSELADGINLFVGDNETGKSTIVDAIRAAFFERHKSSKVDHLRPWGDTSAAPEVELAFDWQGTPWQLSKRFLKKQRCDLRIGQEVFSGGEAEDRLAELLGYTFAPKGASKAEHQGIPGLLWVTQGAVQDIRGPVSHAGDHLQSALGSTLSEVTSSSGDALINRVEKERGQLLTGTGKPTGDYRQTNEQCDIQWAALDNLEQEVRQYREQVDELGRLRRRQHEIDTVRPWQAQRQKAEEAQGRLHQVNEWQRQQQDDENALANCRQTQQHHRQQLKDFAAQAGQLEERAEACKNAQDTLNECQDRRPQLGEQLEQAQKSYDEASQNQKQARQQAARDKLQSEHDQLAKTLARQEQTLDTARTLQREVEQLREQQQADAIDEKALQRLRLIATQLSELRIQQEALASQLEYDLRPDKHLVIGDETVTGKGEQPLLDETELTIPDVGTLRLKPGGTDVAELRRQQEQLVTERDGLLQQLGVDSLEAGEQRAADNQKLAATIKERAARLDGLAPNGVDVLANQHRLDTKQLEQLTDQLAEYPEARMETLSEKTAETALDKAQSKLIAVENAVNEHKSDFAMARQALETANTEWEGLKAKMQTPERKQREKEANDGLIDLNAEENRLNKALQRRQQQIDDARPDTLAQDVERYNKSADAMEADANERVKAVERIQVTLEALGAKGLEERRDTLQQEAERLQRRRDELADRAAALDLLLDMLKDKRQALTRQLQEPLQKHLNHYLQLLFPQASLTVDDDLIPDTLSRNLSGGEEQGDVQALSYGAREQMGLISRLAYADLLREARKPTLMILDDALVHCDATRLEQMKRILFDAAQRHQILLFSCHPEKWRDLGVAPRELRELKTAPA